MDKRIFCRVNIFYKNPEQKPVWKFITKGDFMWEEKLSEEDFDTLKEKSQIYFVEIIGWPKEDEESE